MWSSVIVFRKKKKVQKHKAHKLTVSVLFLKAISLLFLTNSLKHLHLQSTLYPKLYLHQKL